MDGLVILNWTKNIYTSNLIIHPSFHYSVLLTQNIENPFVTLSQHVYKSFIFVRFFRYTKTFNIFYNPTLTIMFTHEYIIPPVYKFFIGP